MSTAVTNGIVFERARLIPAADWLAVAVAVSLPWSTSATGILIVLWLIAVLPTLDLASVRRVLAIPACYLPAALFGLGVLGMAWADASMGDRFGAIKAFARLLLFPVLFVQFERSERGPWVIAGFLASCTALLGLSWTLDTWPSLAWRGGPLPPGVPVKDYIIQSGEFMLCAFALIHLAISAWRDRRIGSTVALGMLAAAFLANIIFVTTARSTLVAFAALLLALGLQRFRSKGILGALTVGVVVAASAWASSPYLRGRVLAVLDEVQQYRTENAETSAGIRLEFWKKSLQFVATAPVWGHGTGSIKRLFEKAATGGQGTSSLVTDQPHNQILIVAIQLGLVGVGLLLATWIAHLWLFRGSGLVAWLGLGLVVQNVVACMFNSYLFEFTMGWLYVLGVGVLGGMMLGRDPKRQGPSVP